MNPCPNCLKNSQASKPIHPPKFFSPPNSQQIEKFQILNESQKDWITRLQKELQQAHQLLAQVKRKNQEVNNELVKSNIRSQKALQDAEKTQRELAQKVTQLEKEVSQYEAHSEKVKSDRERANVSSSREGENPKHPRTKHQKPSWVTSHNRKTTTDPPLIHLTQNGHPIQENAKQLEDQVHFLRETVQATLLEIQTSLTNRPEPLDLNFSPLQTASELERTFQLSPEVAEKKREPLPLPLPPSQENLEENQDPLEYLDEPTFWELSSIKPIDSPTPVTKATPQAKKKRKRDKPGKEEREEKNPPSSTPLREVKSYPSLRKMPRKKEPISYKEPSRKKKMRREDPTTMK